MAGRKTNRRPTKEAIYVIGEGITEQHYFRHLKAIQGYNYTLIPRFFKITSMERLEKAIEELRADDITVICVFDADTSQRQPAQNAILQRIIRKWEGDESVLLCDSLQAIEYWFILHFEDCCPAHANATQTLRHLKRHITTYEKTGNFLEKQRWVENMMSDGKFANAVDRARRHDNGNSYSRIYKAIAKFESTL